MIDFHNHLTPGADDGAADLGQSRSAVAKLREEGVQTIITTPHLLGSVTENPDRRNARLAEIDASWEQMRTMGAREFPELRLERGAEVMLDTLTPNLTDPRTRLAGTSFALVEFPHMMVPPNVGQVLFHIKMRGWTSVIAHPERYVNLESHLSDVEQWKESGAYLQANAGSLLGRYGARPRALAWQLLENGWVDYLCSDHHARGRVALAEAREMLLACGGVRQAELLFEENAARLLLDEPPLKVPPLQRRRSLWRRVLGLK